MPFARYTNAQKKELIEYHVPHNCAVTSVSMNIMKGMLGPVILKVMAGFRPAATDAELRNAFARVINSHWNCWDGVSGLHLDCVCGFVSKFGGVNIECAGEGGV